MTPQQTITDLRMRCLRANDLRRSGKEQEAAALDPSDEELREGLIALRSQRASATAASTKKKADKAAKAIPLDLNDLFAPKGDTK